jgi:hypothetical protein
MPLPHNSLSHGTIPFGFFNIETDMLLLDRLFFFADQFCSAVTDLARSTPSSSTSLSRSGYRIDDPVKLGNLHGAITGHDLSGFIGSTYRLYPFPLRPEGFKQNPEGNETQTEIRALMEDHGSPVDIEVTWHAAAREISVDEYRFDPAGFDSLIAYVYRGGYPRWKDDVRPGYVTAMMSRLTDAVWRV